MISSIFGKRKPVNFILIAVYLFLYGIISQYPVFTAGVSFSAIALHILMLILLFFTVFGVDLLDRTYHLSAKNAYVMLLFTLMLTLFSKIFTDETIVLAHLFILLAFRRLLGLSHETNVKQKLFDAALWISVATLFYSWAVLYFLILYMAILLYAPRNYKNWLIPPVAATAVLLLCYTYFLWFENAPDFLSVFQFNIRWPYVTYRPDNYFLPFAIVAVMSCIAAFAYGIRAVRKRTLTQATGFLLIVALLVGISMVLFFGNGEKTTLIFMLFPLSVLFANYLVRIRRKWIRESLLWLLLLAPAALLILQFSAKR